MNSMLDFYYWIEDLPISIAIGGSWLYPLLESIHVLAAVFVFGAILTVDLALLGVAAQTYSIQRLVKELVPWSVIAFVIAVITGIGMFITRVSGYVENTAFLWKMFLLLLAGINIFIFHRFVLPSLSVLEGAGREPLRARLSGAFSILLWVGVMLSGRWIGHLV